MKRLAVALLIGCGASDPAPGAWQWDLPDGFPEPAVPADNPMSAAKVELGRYLFYDTRLSENQTQSCGSCHQQARAFTDGRATPLGSTAAVGRHNAMSLANVAYNSAQTWANPKLVDLEQQVLVPLFGDAPVELGLAGREDELLDRLRAEPVYQSAFPAAFAGDTDPVTAAHLAQALASFERTIISGQSPYDRDELSDAAKRGKALFFSEKLECHHCHGGFNLTNAFRSTETPDGGFVQYFNTGLYNLDGAGAYPAGDTGLLETSGMARDMGRFKPPTLRNVAVTGPYMHDGSIATLGEVLDAYARGGRLIADGPNAGDGATSPIKSAFVFGFPMTAGERADLLAFLESLTDDRLVANPDLADPWH